MKLTVSVLLFTVVSLLVAWHGGSWLSNKIIPSPEEIAELASRNCPKAEDMNRRFKRLYARFGDGKEVPHRFVDGYTIDWDNIWYNFDFLLEE